MPAWKDGILESRLIGRAMPYRVILPYDYYRAFDRRYPTLYLLHGLFGSFENWTTLAGLTPDPNLIVVMPEGEDGWYCDGHDSCDGYESYIIAELIPEIDERFRTILGSKSIAGNSMGGYGALKIALKFTGLFSFAASSSGAFAAPSWSDQLPPPNQWDEYRPSISRIFGECDSKIRIENDVYKIVARCDRAKVPDLYFDCGIDDPFLSANEELSKVMGRCDIQHQFQALPGRHDWEYWADRGRFVIEGAARHFLKAETTS